MSMKNSLEQGKDQRIKPLRVCGAGKWGKRQGCGGRAGVSFIFIQACTLVERRKQSPYPILPLSLSFPTFLTLALISLFFFAKSEPCKYFSSTHHALTLDSLFIIMMEVRATITRGRSTAQTLYDIMSFMLGKTPLTKKAHHVQEQGLMAG
jgi:hypothetical protein